MKHKAKQVIVFSTLLIIGLYFLFLGLAKAQPFLVPLVVAMLLAMLMIPVSKKLEAWGIKRGWAAFLSDIILISFFVGLSFIVSSQIQSMAKDWPQMKEKIEPKIAQMQQFIAKHTALSPEEQKQELKKNITGGGNEEDGSSDNSKGSKGGIGTALSKFLGFFGACLLTFVYIFFFLLYRDNFKRSILKFVPDKNKANAEKIIQDSGKVSQNYLFSKFLMTIFIGVFYAIGLSVSGVKHAVLISMLAAILSLIPYIGNVVSYGLAIIMALFAGGSSSALIGVTLTFAVTQFIESYILEPYFVGPQVNLHPLLTIVAIVLGGQVWGVVGMIIAIPAFGIIKVVCDHIRVLNPIGNFLGTPKQPPGGGNNIFKRVYKKFKREKD